MENGLASSQVIPIKDDVGGVDGPESVFSNVRPDYAGGPSGPHRVQRGKHLPIHI